MNTAVALDMGYQAFVDTCGEALGRDAAEVQGGVKGLARAANLNYRTIENIIQKRAAPSGLTIARLLPVAPRFQSAFRQITAMESDLDPMVERAFSELATQIQRTKRL